ncbi:hypothetical protein GCM10007047_31700 [Cerasicoccus arenae]|uniref:Uncharacterized protein n=2 Tax=Cerasicoccus arenae TaxID=424488 RepID=A0A8J3DEQ3_9BACT|nr:hypothetical protein GCM10007047_31700 [Cerasicoccus arenae]
MSTPRLTNTYKLVDIPGLEEHEQACWQIQCLGKRDEHGNILSPVLNQLQEWQQTIPKEYEKLLRAIRYAGANHVHRNQDLIRADEDKRNVYEFKNTSCKCRLFFFYHHAENKVIICTNTYWKGKGAHTKDQDSAFATCAKVRDIYLKSETKP